MDITESKSTLRETNYSIEAIFRTVARRNLPFEILSVGERIEKALSERRGEAVMLL